MTAASATEKIKAALQGTNSQKYKTETDLHQQTGLSRSNLKMWLDTLVKNGQVQTARIIKPGVDANVYWISGSISSKAQDFVINPLAQSQLAQQHKAPPTKTQTPKTPRLHAVAIEENEPKQKAYAILKAIDINPDITMKQISELLGYECSTSFIKAYISRKLVIKNTDNRPVTFALLDKKSAMQVFDAAPKGKSPSTAASGIDKPTTQKPVSTKLDVLPVAKTPEPKSDIPEFTALKEALSAADNPHAQFAFTSDGTLMIKQSNKTIELSQANSLRLMQFIDNQARFAMQQQNNHSTSA